MDTRSVVARFEAERQALAMMEHPNIARVLDAGSTASGRPYFVMELVRGIPITQFCDEAELDTRRRLELFLETCRAVQHAHQKGIIHRDLKPSNVLVTLRDDTPNVKIIDFGIAKATEQKLTEKTLFTAFGQIVGTPVYMSPEQAVMSELDVDTRSDVYSLGILLYELLTGATPIDPESLRGAALDEMCRIIREETPPKPSTKLSTLAEGVDFAAAARRHAKPHVLARELHGDLDWIVMKALEKDRTRRYESASAFAQDIERHMISEPVSAAAPSRMYRLRKFVERHRRTVVLTTSVVLMLIVATVVSTWMAIRATRSSLAEFEQREIAEANEKKAVEAASVAKAASDRAQKRLEQIEKANRILGSIFHGLDPEAIAESGKPLQAVLVEKLDLTVEELEGDAIGDPLVVASMQFTLGQSLLNLGEPDKAVVLFEKARHTQVRELGRGHLDTVATLVSLGCAYDDAGRPDQAVSLLEGTHASLASSLPSSHEALLGCRSVLASALASSGDADRARRMFEGLLPLREAKFGESHSTTRSCRNSLGHTYWSTGRADLALPLFERNLELTVDEFGESHPETIAWRHNVASACLDLGDSERAIRLHEGNSIIAREHLGSDHPSALKSGMNLALAYERTGQLDRAIRLLEEVLEAMERKQGDDHPLTIQARDNLSRMHLGRDMDRLQALSEKNFVLSAEKHGPDHSSTLRAAAYLGLCHISGGRPEEAQPLLEQAYRGKEALVGFHFIGGALMDTYVRLGKREKIAALAKPLLDDVRLCCPEGGRTLGGELAVIGSMLLSGGAHVEAEAFLRECIKVREEVEPDAWVTFNARSMLGGALLGQKKYVEAEPLLIAGYQGMRERETTIPPAARARLAEALQRLVDLYESRNAEGDAAKAQKYRDRPAPRGDGDARSSYRSGTESDD